MPALGARRAGELVVPAVIFASSRVACFVIAYLATRMPPGRSLIDVLGAWDAGFYLRIADGGYPAEFDPGAASVHAFFPLYPAAIRFLNVATPLSGLQAATWLNVVFGTVAMVLLWLLIERFADRDAATRAVALVSFFPWSFVLTMGYAEPLLLALAAGCLLALADRRWLVAGGLAALASAARPNGAALGFCCAWAAWQAIRQRKEWKALVAPVLAPLGLVAFFAFLGARTGDPLANVRIKGDAFGDQGIGLEPSSLWPRLEGFVNAPLNDLNMLSTVISVAIVIAGVFAMTRWKPPLTFVLWSAPVVLLAVVFTTYGSMPRFVLTAFPLLAAIAVVVRGPIFSALLGASATLMGGLTIIASTTIIFTP